MPPVLMTSFPWTGTTPGSAGPYSASQFAAFFNGMYAPAANDLNNSALASTGVIRGGDPTGSLGHPVIHLPGWGFDVLAAGGMVIQVAQGTAVVQGTFAQMLGTAFTIANNSSGNPRIDTLVIHLDYTAQTADLRVLQGTPAATPAPNNLTQTAGVIWEIAIADILVANGAVSIAQSNITPRQVFSNVPDGVYVSVHNVSGVTLQTGDVVVWGPGISGAYATDVSTSTLANDQTVAGVIVGRIINNEFGQMLVKGYGWVNAPGGAADGQMLVQSTTAKQALAVNKGANPSAFGMALAAVSAGAGLVPAFIDASIAQKDFMAWVLQNRPAPYVVRQGVSDYTTSSTAFVDVDGANLIVSPTLLTPNGRVLVVATFSGTPAVNTAMYFDIIVDSTSRAGGTNGLTESNNNNNTQHFTVVALFTGLTQAAHTFKLQWRTAAGTATLNNNGAPITMFALQI